MEAFCFPRIVAHHPYIVLLIVFTFSSICLIIPLTTEKFPDFSDPQMGFEARGTILAQRLTAWNHLIEATKPRGELTDNPIEYQQYIRELIQPNANVQNHSLSTQGILRKKPKGRDKRKGKKHRKVLNNTDYRETSDDKKDAWKELLELKDKDNTDIEDEETQASLDSDNFFCNLPTSSYSRVVIAVDSEERNNLWSMEGVLAQCHIDGVLRGNVHFPSLCQTRNKRNGLTSDKCCRSWSPANYVALLSNRTSCLGVTENDLSRVKALLQKCSEYYYNRQLLPNCAEDFSCQKHVPTECYTRNAAYHLLHYLLDVNFISKSKTDSNGRQNSTLHSAMLFLPIAASSATLDFYKAIDDDDLMYGNFRVQGMQLGLKSTLFDRLLLSDSSLVLAGSFFVTLCILAYTGSIVLTVATIFAVLFSLGISYATYTLVLRIEFFPFMNLLAIVVAVGIGADDAFIYCKVWESKKQQKLSNGGLVQETMKHAFPSMFVTSLTTAVAFFASIVSNVTAINCFSLFSGMTVIANFFLMITWLPACVVVSEHFNLSALWPVNFITRKIIRPLRSLGDKVTVGFSTFLTLVVLRLRWFWLLSLGITAIACCSIVFRYPGLQLPDYMDFQLFHDAHLFEKYDLVYSRRFWFERYEMVGGDAQLLPLRFVWGMKPVDNGDYLDPSKKGTPVYDETFDITHPKSQLWLEQFCRNLRNQPFYHATSGPLLSNCFIESLRSWMERSCEDPIDPHVDYMPCCKSSKFPYEPDVLQQCAAEVNARMHRTPYLWTRDGPLSAGPKFAKVPLSAQASNDTLVKETPKIEALVVEFDSKYAYSLAFGNMDTFFHEVESWMQTQLRTAPKGMRGGWFISHLEFYELQRTLYQGTIWAMGMSLTLALIVLALVTLNPLISLYAIIAIAAVIIVTVAVLILLGWTLNILESVAICTCIGLAVDFSLHYAVSYKACISSHVLAYIQIGLFLLLFVVISWIYATLFLCSMLAIVGPSSHSFAQFEYPRFKVCFHKYEDGGAVEAGKDNNRARKTYKGRGMLSESTLSTSSSVCQFHCSELETLAARPPSPSLPPSPLSTLLR